MSIRRSLIATLGVVALIAAASHAAKAAVGSDRRAERPFVEKTLISAPKRIGEFILESASYSPEQKFSGAALQYGHPDHPAIRFSLFIYPAGKMSQEQAMTSGMKVFRASLDEGVKIKFFNDLKVLESIDFSIPLRARTVADTPSVEAADVSGGNGDAKDEILPSGLLALTDSSQSLKGQRLSLSYEIKDEATGGQIPMRSRGYLFYKQMYYYKGRISAANSQSGETEFSSMSDRAMRELIPAIEALNIGGCSNITVYVNVEETDEKKRADDLMASLLQASRDQETRNCAAEIETGKYAAEHPDAEIITIEYAPNDWTSQ
jgi:hypothetical protein